MIHSFDSSINIKASDAEPKITNLKETHLYKNSKHLVNVEFIVLF